MNKKTTHAFGDKLYLLGIDHDGKYVWLPKHKWQCGWYYSMGYVEIYTNHKHPERAKDISSHSHLSYELKRASASSYVTPEALVGENGFLAETTLDKDDLWKFQELLWSAYKLKEAAEIFSRGGAHITTNPCHDTLKDEEMYNTTNRMIDEVLTELENLLDDGAEN